MAFDTGISSAVAQYVYTQSNGAVTEPIGGSYLQAYCEFLGVTEPLNASWLIALCNHFSITEPLNGSWTIALSNYYGIVYPTGGTWWMALANAPYINPTPPFIWGLDTLTFGLETRVWNIGTPVAPTADFTSNTTSIFEGDQVQFTDTSTGLPTSWNWSFAGGTPLTSTDQNPLIQYDTAGLYSVSLEAINGAGSNTKTVPDYLTVTVETDLIWDTTDTDWNLEEVEWLVAIAPGTPTFDQEGDLLSSNTPTLTGTADPTNGIILTVNGTTYNGTTDGLGVWSIDVTTGLPGAAGAGQNYSVDITAKDAGTGLETSIVGSVNILKTTTTITFELRTEWSLYWYFAGMQVEQEVTPGVWTAIEWEGNPTWNNGSTYYKVQPLVSAGISSGYQTQNVMSFRPNDESGAGQNDPIFRDIILALGFNYRIVAVNQGTPNTPTNYGRFNRYTVLNGATVILPQYDGEDVDWLTGNVQQTFTL